VHKRITRKFARRRNELGSVERAEGQPRCPLLNRLACKVHLIGRSNLEDGFA
jgi:hypothetical protein